MRCRTNCPAACASGFRSPARLLGDPRILLMDEPFGALDEITRDRLNDELLHVWRETGTTILFVTHSIQEAAYLGQQVLMLAARPGRVRELIPVDLPEPRQLADPRHRGIRRPGGTLARRAGDLLMASGCSGRAWPVTHASFVWHREPGWPGRAGHDKKPSPQ